MTEINPILKNTSAYKIAENLDKQDGSADGKISGSIWNTFVEGKGGKKISENGSITLENAMKSITTYAVRNAKSENTTANDLGDKWLNATPTEQSDDTDSTEGTGEETSTTENTKHVGTSDETTAKKPAVKNNTIAEVAKQQGLRPTYNPKFYYSETEKEHYKWNPKTQKFVKYANIAYFNKDQSYVRKYKNSDGSAKVIDYSKEGYPTRMQARNYQNKTYLNKDFVVKKLGLQPTYASKTENIYYDKGTKMHYKWNEKTHSFDALDKDVRFVTQSGAGYGKDINKVVVIKLPNGRKKEVVKTSSGSCERIYDAKGKLQTRIDKDTSGKTTTTYTHYYNQQGNETKVIGKDANNALIYNRERKYNKNGSLDYGIDTEYENGKKTSVKRFNSNMNYTYEEAYENGVKTDSWKYNLDSKGKQVGGTRKYFNNDGSINEIRDYELDKDGNEIKTVYKDANNNTTSIDYWTRDKNGKATACRTTDANGNVKALWEYTYYSNGKDKKDVKKTPLGKTTDVWVYKYDSDGNFTEKIHYDGKGNIIKD